MIWQHVKQVLRHKWYVLIAGWRLGVPLWRLLIHDLSKFSPSEMVAYARQFHGDRTDPSGFAYAWLHHQNKSDHHWEHWVSRSSHVLGHDDGGPLPMPLDAVREMVADWFAAGKVYAGRWPDPYNFTWFRNNIDKMRMHAITWNRVYATINHATCFQW